MYFSRKVSTALLGLTMVSSTALAGTADCQIRAEQALKTHNHELVTQAASDCKAAEQAGIVMGTYELGRMMLEGLIGDAPAQGVNMIEKAAQQGLLVAKSRLGRIYLSGDHVPQDFDKAFKWFLDAAVEGDPIAQYEVGQRYYKGQGTDQDNVKAYLWFAVAQKSNEKAGDVARAKLSERKKEKLEGDLSWGEKRKTKGWISDWKPGISTE